MSLQRSECSVIDHGIHGPNRSSVHIETSSEFHNFQSIFHGTNNVKSKVSRFLTLLKRLQIVSMVYLYSWYPYFPRSKHMINYLYWWSLSLLAAPSHLLGAFRCLFTFYPLPTVVGYTGLSNNAEELSPIMTVPLCCTSFSTEWMLQEDDRVWLFILSGAAEAACVYSSKMFPGRRSWNLSVRHSDGYRTCLQYGCTPSLHGQTVYNEIEEWASMCLSSSQTIGTLPFLSLPIFISSQLFVISMSASPTLKWTGCLWWFCPHGCCRAVASAEIWKFFCLEWSDRYLGQGRSHAEQTRSSR